ncbi:hypothetical protein HGRIS_010755 [Hohenbuehelia grisea]|uniref:Uncharacterized protein n=1 Tax=Hohenbuehelia grisea TaxID=104357 RepID=A0ABR3IXS6_9AGAR
MSKDNYDFRPIPNKQDITELVVSKGTMANWDRTFKDLAWPDMIAWLSGSQDAPPQSDVLGLARPTLSLVRTKAVEWTAQQKALEVVERQKQEKKAKGSKKGKDDAAGSSKKGKGKSGTVLLRIFGVFAALQLLGLIPCVAASSPAFEPFPDIAFSTFAAFIQAQFSSDISLSTVLVLLTTLTNNSELLNLHTMRQQTTSSIATPRPRTGWMSALAS